MTDLHAHAVARLGPRADCRTRRLNRPARAFADLWPFEPEGHRAR
jgi:hypothetical protein